MRKHCPVLSIAFICICWLTAGTALHAQVIKGRITDAGGRPVSNASLFVKELKLGTAANEDGYYDLKVTGGAYTCVFQCIGYETETQTITVGSSETITQNITLREKSYAIREVVITDRKEDPAYGIMRRAIAMAPYYMNQVSEFNSDVYMKGSLQIIKISKLVKRLARDELEEYREGNTYVEESFNEIQFTAPNKYKQKVLKKTGSLPDSENGSAMELVTTSVYDPKALLPVISPLSSSAFAHYRFRYEGFIEEDDRVINKIRITPIHKSKQLLSGYIYIADNYWNVHSVDVSGQFVMGINFRMQVNFGEVNENVWMPVSHRIDFDASILGNKGTFHYVSSVKYRQVTENISIRKPDALLLAEQQRKAMQQYQAPPLALTEKAEQKSKTSARIEKLLEKEDLSNRESYKLARLMQKEANAEKKDNQSLNLTETLYEDYKVTVDSAAGERDTAYWEKMRPVPLNPDELQSYREKETRLAAPQQKDTTKNRRRMTVKSPFLRTTAKVLWGADIKPGKKGGTLEYRGLKLSKLGFNTVDGFFAGQKLTWYKDFKKKERENRLTLEPEVIWAVNRKAVMWDVNASLSYAPMRRGIARIRFGQVAADHNDSQGIYPLENTVSSLFFRRNYLKLYGDNFVEANNTIDIVNGLQLFAKLKYAHRVMLDNTGDYSFFYRDSREYTSNVPANVELATPPVNHTSAAFMLNLNYTPRFYYRVDRNNRKRMVKSNFPTFFVTWQKGVNGLWGGDSNFDHLAVGLRQSIETGLMQRFNYLVRGGMFLNDKSVFFPDFKHFVTTEIPVTIGSISNQSFNLLEYYRYSTSDKYLEAHAYYYAPFLLLKYLPFFSNRLWQEGLQFNFLYTPGIKNYTELGYTIGIVWQAGVFAGFENFKYRSFGVKLSLPLALIL
ncbi:MAG: DUF5686 and carboxypeptidase regulatory-like domain-containing protein [Bacteroidales bacterium]|jgi:hypothetical protein|nr:DUF5686 and carboxypeptidase regulatory-like domain-containing protein [Bacteroidales bacterium]